MRRVDRHLASAVRAGIRQGSAVCTTLDARKAAPILDPDIETLDLSYASFYLVAKDHWRFDKVQRAEREYKLMLQLTRANPDEQIVPTHLADLFWHAALMCNEIYNAQCMRLFGRVLYHDPFAGLRGEQDALDQIVRFQRSRQLQAEIERGVVPPPQENEL